MRDHTGLHFWGGRGGCTDAVHGRINGRMAIDPRIPTMPPGDGARRLFTDQAGIFTACIKARRGNECIVPKLHFSL